MATIGQISVGATGYVIIDDDGTYIRLYLQQNDGATFIGSPGKDWWGNVNGTPLGGKFTWASGGGKRLIAGPYAVGYTQNVNFGIGATGTRGFGTGGTAYATAYRATVPPAPIPLGIDQITPTSFRYRFSDNGNGGSTNTGYQAIIARDANFSQGVQIVASGGTTIFADLLPATRYWVASRSINAVGAGPWSTPSSDVTASGAYASINGVWVPVPINVSNGSAWNSLAPLVSDGAAWEAAI